MRHSLPIHPARGFACMVTLLISTLSFGLPFLSTSKPSNSSSTSSPPMTFPKTVFMPSRCGAGASVMKNWLPLELGPLFAMLTMPRALWRRAGLISSSKRPLGVS